MSKRHVILDKELQRFSGDLKSSTQDASLKLESHKEQLVHAALREFQSPVKKRIWRLPATPLGLMAATTAVVVLGLGVALRDVSDKPDHLQLASVVQSESEEAQDEEIVSYEEFRSEWHEEVSENLRESLTVSTEDSFGMAYASLSFGWSDVEQMEIEDEDDELELS